MNLRSDLSQGKVQTYKRGQPVRARVFPFFQGLYTHTDEMGNIHFEEHEGNQLYHWVARPEDVYPIGPAPLRNDYPYDLE